MKIKIFTYFMFTLFLTTQMIAQQWTNVGSAGFSAGAASYTSIAIDGNGTPYVVYSDDNNSGKATVKKYDGSSWVNVGSAGFSAGGVRWTSITLDGSGTPYVVFEDWSSPISKATVMKYDGSGSSGWVYVGSGRFSVSEASYTSIAIDGSGTPYVVYQDGGNSSKATVMKYDGSGSSGWVYVGSAGFSAGEASNISIAIDVNGTPYVVYRDVGNSSKATVMKYDGSGSSGWVNVGAVGFSVGQASYTSIAIDGSGTPYVVYLDWGNSYKATVMKYNGSSGWVNVGSAGFSAGDAIDTRIAIDGSGTPYVVYQDYSISGNKATVMKYDGSGSSGWVNVGSAGFSAGAVDYTSIAIDGNGTPYVVYQDGGNSGKATVMKYLSPIYVDQTASGSNDGTTWANAYTSLQSALVEAVSGKEIWVAKGTYKPSTEVGGTGDRFKAFQMKNGVQIYGGFAGTETYISQRTDFAVGGTNETILSGDFDDDDVVSGSGSTLSITGNSENCYHVIYHPEFYSLSSTAVLDGFTIKGGNANGSANPWNDGGGLYNADESSDGQTPTINNCYFTGNQASDNGGAIMNVNTDGIIITNCTFALNYATDAGGGISNYSSDASITNCLFYGNRAKDEKGGAIYNYAASNPTITNCTITENSSVSGGGIYNVDNSDITVINSIIYGNTITTGVGAQIRNYTNSNLTISYSDIEGGISGIYSTDGGSTTDGGNNIDADPKFVGSGDYPYSILGTSPCADAGNDSYNTETYDIRGTGFERKLNKTNLAVGTIDMGAYEYNSPSIGNHCLAFDGTDDYVSIPASNDWALGTGDFTVEWWQYQTDNNSYPRIFSLGGSNFAVSIESGYIFFWMGGSNVNVSAGTYKGQWVHFACTRSSGTVSIYKNGTSIKSGSNSGNINNSADPLLLGKYSAASEHFGGKLDEFRIWNVARTSSEISDNMNNTSLSASTPGLLAYYHFDQGIAGGTNTGVTSLTDATSNNHDGTLTNFALTGTTSNWVSADDNTALPVELTSFTANVNENSVTLNWQTATEVNNYGFEVQKSEVGTQNSEWAKIGFVQGNGTTNSPKSYSFADPLNLDLNPNLTQASYRLKQIDNDGTFAYSKTVTVDLTTITDVEDDEIPIEYSLSQNYPNPFNPTTTIKFGLPENGFVNLRVYNILGEEVARLVNEELQAGYHTAGFNATQLASGIYFYKIQTGNFMKIKKMLLIK